MSCSLLLACEGEPQTDAGRPDSGQSDAAEIEGDAGPAHPCHLINRLPGISDVTDAAVIVDGPELATVAVTGSAGGVHIYELDWDCIPRLRGRLLEGVAITDLAAVNEGNTTTGNWDIAVLTESRELLAIEVNDLSVVYTLPALPIAGGGGVGLADLGGDMSLDIVAFDEVGTLLVIEPTSTGFEVRSTVAIPAGVSRVIGGTRSVSELLLLMGDQLDQLIRVADFDYSDRRTLSSQPHRVGAFADSWPEPEALVALGTSVVMWRIVDHPVELRPTVASDLGAQVIDMHSSGHGPVILALAGEHVYRIDDVGAEEMEIAPTPSAIRVFAPGGMFPEAVVVVTSDAQVRFDAEF